MRLVLFQNLHEITLLTGCAMELQTDRLLKRIDPPAAARRFLVYTSAGDQANLHSWLSPDRQFDLWITYYGNNAGRYQTLADYYHEGKGAKFPNLHRAHTAWPEIFSRYEAVLVLDDDIIINANEIHKLFVIRHQYDLWALQPCFDPRSKISHNKTRWNPRYFLRFTNFVEMNAPLFKREILDNFLAIYDPKVTGWGTDWWYMSTMGNNINGRAAIVDAVRCINPYELQKSEARREMDKLPEGLSERKRTWLQIQQERGIEPPDYRIRIFGGIKQSYPKAMLDSLVCYLLKKASKRWRRQHGL